MKKYWVSLCLAVVSCASFGCGGNEVSDKTLSSLQSSVDRGKALFYEKNYDAALPVLTEATKSSHVGHEQLVELLLMKARCNLYTGKIDAALADIEMAEQGAEDLSQIHLAKYEYWQKKGESSKAEESFRIAQSINPEARLPNQ